MTRLELRGLSGRRLRRLDLSLSAGVHALVGGPDEEAAEVVALCAGIVRPKRGTVRLDGAQPFLSPETRGRIGALLRVEEPLEGGSVEASVARALHLHRSVTAPRDALTSFGLESLLGRSPADLSPREVRSVALALALSLQAPLLLVLHEPFAAGLSRGDVEARLLEHAEGGTVVLSILASAREAAESGAAPVFIGKAVNVEARASEPGTRP